MHAVVVHLTGAAFVLSRPLKPQQHSPRLRSTHAIMLAPPASPAAALTGVAWAEATGAHHAAPYYDVFKQFATSEEFVHATFAREPLLMSHVIDGVAGSFTLDDLQIAVDGDFLDAGRGVADGVGGWKMAPVSEPRGPSFEEAKMRYVDVAAAQIGSLNTPFRRPLIHHLGVP